MSDRLTVSHSKMGTWRRCKQAYHYKYVDKLSRNFKSRPLRFGTLIHEMIEASFNGDDPFEYLEQQQAKLGKQFKALADEYGEIIQDVGDIMEEYFEHWEHDDLQPIKIKGSKAEHEFEIELADGLVWNGKIDALAKRNKLKWLVEHKSFGRKPGVDDRWRNTQSTTYSRAIDILGWKPVDGTCWDYVWSKPPKIPNLLASGEMSQSKLDTLPNVVRRFIKKNALDRKKYKDYVTRTKLNRTKWFDRIYTPLHKSTVDLLFNQFRDTAFEIRDNHGKLSGMSIDRHCSWCDFEPLCRAKLEGGDYDFIKERNYGPNKRPKDENRTVHEGSYQPKGKAKNNRRS